MTRLKEKDVIELKKKLREASFKFRRYNYHKENSESKEKKSKTTIKTSYY